MFRGKQLCILAAVDALTFGGLGAWSQTVHANESPDVLALNLVASGDQWEVYIDNKPGDPGVSNTGGVTVNPAGSSGSFEDAPANTYSYKVGTKTCSGASGFSLDSSNGIGSSNSADGSGDGVLIFAFDHTNTGGPENFAYYVGYGITSGTDASVPLSHNSISGYSPANGGVSRTQTSLGVEIANGTYSGTTGTLQAFGDSGVLQS
jgi:hypothetical protein